MNQTSTTLFSCASAKTPKKGPVELKDSDFQSFCCDGYIVGWSQSDPPSVLKEFAFEDLTCCRLPPTRAFGNDTTFPTTCHSDANPTPLASLAGTGTTEAQLYDATYTITEGTFPSAELVNEENGSSVTAIVVRETPYCFWVDTAHGVSMTSVEVQKAEVTTLPPLSGTTPLSLRPIQETGASNATQSQARSTSSSGEESRTSSAGPEQTGASTTLKVPVVISLGVLFASWLV